VQTDATESRRSTSKGNLKGKVRKQWRNEYNIRYRDREGFEMYILWSLNLEC